jgi:cellulose synthase (UDP-forming)
VFLIAPLFYLLFGLKIFEASLDEFFAFVVLHVVCSLMLSNYLFGPTRWPFVSDLYELVQSPFTFGALASVLRNPKKPQFKVTPKNQTVERDFVPGIGKGFFVLLAVLVGAAAIGVWRWFDVPFEREHLTIVMAWNLINLVLALAAAGVMYERAGRPVGSWVSRKKPINLVGYQSAGRGTLLQVGLDTARLRLGHEAAAQLDLDDGRVIVQMAVPGRSDLRLFPALVDARTSDRDAVTVDVTWVLQNDDEDRDLIAVVYGDSQAWVDFQAERARRRTVLGGLAYLLAAGFGRVTDLAFGRPPRTATATPPVPHRQTA